MTVTLDAATEARIQQEIDRGTYRDASEVIAHALALLDDEPELSPQARIDLDARLECGMAQIARGEGIPGDRLMQALADRRQARLTEA